MVRCTIYRQAYVATYALASLAMGHSRTCSLNFEKFNFSVHIRAAQSLQLTATVCSWLSKHICYILRES